MYYGMYKYRLCNKKYDRIGCANSEIIKAYMMETLDDIPFDTEKFKTCIPKQVPMNEIHFCKDGSMGVADFIGFEAREK